MPLSGSTRSSPNCVRRTRGRLRTTSISPPTCRHTCTSRTSPIHRRTAGLGGARVRRAWRRPSAPPGSPRLGAYASHSPWRHRRRAPARRRGSDACRRHPAALPALDALTDAGLFDGLLAESAATARTMERLARRARRPALPRVGLLRQALCAAYGGEPSADIDAELDRPRRGRAVAVRLGLDRVLTGGALPARRPAPRARPLRRRRRPRPYRPQSVPRRRRHRFIVLAAGTHRRSGRGARRLRRGHAPVGQAGQHRPAADDAAQPRRPVPARRGTRTTGRAARRRRPW